MVHPVAQASFGAIASMLAVLFYTRGPTLYLFYVNAPGRLEHEVHVKNPSVLFANNIRNCEDILLNEAQGWALLSCDPGRDNWNTVMGTFIEPRAPPETGLYLWQYADQPNSPPEKLKLLDFPTPPEDMHPLGIEYEPESQTLFMVNHAESGSRIDIFRLFAADAAATHIRTVKHPSISAPNSIAALNQTHVLFTNDHYFRPRYNPKMKMLEDYLGLPLGNIGLLDLSGSEPQVQNLMAEAFANGIVMLDSETVAAASSVGPSVSLYKLSQNEATGAPQLLRYNTVYLKHHVDNLSVDGNGKLLMAGHPHGPSIGAVAKNNRFCHLPGEENAAICEATKPPASWIQEWSEEEGLKTLYLDDGFSTATTAVRDVKRKVGFASGLYEKGILTWDA